MCVSPIRIKNRSNHFDTNQPLYFSVPCGKCYECLKAKRNEWFVRCYYEWKQSFSAFFYTLTFNNENLPTFMGKPCFSKRLIQLFIKRLRFRLREYGISLKYLVVSEFGTLYARPHHHAAFYLDRSIQPQLFYKLVEETWQYGFVKAGDNLGLINSYRGLQYVIKYVTKDYTHTDDFFDTLAPSVYQRFSRLLYYIQRHYKIATTWSLYLDMENRRFYLRSFAGYRLSSSPDKEFLQNFLTKVRSVLNSRMPFHLQSTRLGYDYALQNKSRLVLDGKVFAPTKNNIMPYALPRAWKRLFWYDVVENENDGKKNRFILNEEGKQHYLSTLSQRVEDGISRLINVQLQHPYIDEGALNAVNDQIKKKKYLFHDTHELSHFVRNIDADFETLSVYITVFRDRIIPPEMLDVELTQYCVKSSYHDYADYCLTSLPTYDYGKIYDAFEGCPREQFFNLVTWNSHPFFVMYERLAVVLLTLNNYFTKLKADAAFERERTSRQIRELFKKL